MRVDTTKPLEKFQRNLAYYFSEVLEYPFAKPYWIYMSLSHKCTYRCQMCGVVKVLNGYELSTKAAMKVLHEISYWRRDCVVMFTGGEVFLRKDIFELIRYAVKQNIKVETVSNGALIDAEKAQRIILSGLENIAISLDGACSETHYKVRQAGSFEKAISALKNLVAAKKRNGDGPQISVWTTIMRENISELYDMIRLVRDIGVECLVYHPVIVAQEDMQNTSSDAKFWLTQEEIPLLKTEIDKIVGYQKKNGLVSFLHDPYLWLDYFSGTVSKKQWKCNPFVFVNIGPDGRVRSCGNDFGNILHHSLDECLHSQEAHQARALMKQCQKSCLQTCWAHPESDSLVGIITVFLESLRNYNSSERKKLVEEAYRNIDQYEHILVEYEKTQRNHSFSH